MRVNWTTVGIAATAAAIVVGWVAWALHAPEVASFVLRGGKATDAGAWGDSFGAFNALFGALGFSAVFATLVLQGRAIRQQQLDQRRQEFDATFFQLLALLREVRSELRYTGASTTKGEEAGPAALKAALADMKWWMMRDKPLDRELTKEEVAAIYASKVHARAEDGLGPYFRLIYTILRRLHETPVLTEKERIDYANLLRGQLGSPEVTLMAVNALTQASKNFSFYVSQYRMPRYAVDPMFKTHIERWYGKAILESRPD